MSASPRLSARALVLRLFGEWASGTANPSLGYLLAPPPLIQILTNTKAPYNISLPTASLALAAVSDEGLANMSAAVSTLNANRDELIAGLSKLPSIGRILGGNEANFVLVEILDDGSPSNEKATRIYKTMAESRGVVVRYRGNENGCLGCLRVTVGTAEECAMAIERIAELL